MRRSSLTCKHGKIFPFSNNKNKTEALLLLHLISSRNSHIFNCRKFLGVAKIWYPPVPGWHLPPHVTPWLRACIIPTVFFQSPQSVYPNSSFRSTNSPEIYTLLLLLLNNSLTLFSFHCLPLSSPLIKTFVFSNINKAHATILKMGGGGIFERLLGLLSP